MNNTTLQDKGLFILRLGFGIMFLLHGFPKLMGGPATWESLGGAMSFLGITFAPQFWGFMAAVSEFIGALCLLTGLYVRPASVFMFITMGVAAAMHLGKGDGIMGASHAIEDGIVFLSLIIMGGGSMTIPTILKGNK